MKNIIKKFSLIVTTFVLLFMFTGNVSAKCGADEKGCYDTVNRTIRVFGYGTEQLMGSVGPYGRTLDDTTVTYKVEYNNKQNFGTKAINFNPGNPFWFYRDKYTSMFCLDPQQGSGRVVFAARGMLDPKEEISVQAFDVAMMSALTRSGSNTMSNGNRVEHNNETEYWARLMAMRAIVYIWGSYYNESETSTGVRFATDMRLVRGTVYKWLNDPAVKPVRAKLVEALKARNGVTQIKDASAFYKYRGSSFNNASGILEQSKTIFIAALQDATDFLNDSTNNSKISSTVNSNDSEKEEIDGKVLVKKDVEHVVKISGLEKKDNSKFIIDNLVLNGTYNGLTAKITKIQIGTYETQTEADVQALLGKNVFEIPGSANFDFKNETEIKITVHFEGYESSEDDSVELLKCSQAGIKYYIPITYSGGNLFGEWSKYVGIIWRYNRYTNGKTISKNVQRYATVEEAGDGNFGYSDVTFKSENEVYLIDECDCSKLKDQCVESNDLNSEACKEFLDSNCGPCDELDAKCKLGDEDACEEKAKVCEPECDVTFEGNLTCCEGVTDTFKGTLSVGNGSADDYMDEKIAIKGPEDIMGCFVNSLDKQCDNGEGGNCSNVKGAEDDKHNSYTLASQNENKYCTVSCKENYFMQMPKAQLVNSGRYFTFKTKIEAEKYCYTNTINREQFTKDVTDAQVRLVKAFNEYLRVKTAYNTSIRVETSNCCSECGGTYNSYYLESTSPYSYDYKINDNGTVTITKADGLTYSDSSTGSSSCPCDGCTPPKKGCCGRSCGGCSSGSKSTVENNVKTAFDKAEKELASAQENYNKIVKDYTDCSGWTSDINFKPNVYYDYQEDYLEKNSLTGEMVMEKENTITTTDWYCNSTVSSDGVETAKAKLNGSNYDKCSVNEANSKFTTTDMPYVYCDKDDCKVQTVKVSNARYKKVVSKTSAVYKPATLFYNIYPSGEIVAKDKADEATKGKATEIPNGLPVSLKTQRGIYKYTVNIDNVGEFYADGSKDNLGRYIGSGKDSSILDDTFVYACAYLVNIPTTEGWLCNFDDKCDKNCISNCQGPGCSDSDKDFCNGIDCVSSCVGVGCIYDKDAGSSLLEREVSLNNLFPNGTDSYNWNVFANGKAAKTVEEIEEAGNTIYEKDPILSITIDPSMARMVKAYNKQEENNGGYSNSTLDCYKLGDYEEAACYSSFVNDMLDKKYGDNVVNDKSKIKDDKYRTRTDVELNAEATKDTYFKGWQDVSVKNMLGPSWK